MSPIGRIFIILNLVLAAVFLGVASHALATRENWRTQYETESVRHEEEMGEAQRDLETARTELAQRTESERRIREERDLAIAERDRLQGEVQELQRANAQLRGDVTAIKATLDDYNRTIQEVTAAKDRSVEQRQEAIGQREEALRAQREAEMARRDAQDLRQQLETTIEDLEVARTELSTQVEDLQTQLSTLVDVTGVSLQDITAVPLIDGSVLDVRDQLVMLNVGADEGVKRGFTFEVYDGRQYKGRVRVTDVRQGTSVAQILSTVEGAAISRGDRASTRI